jgi:hypothetical protein
LRISLTHGREKQEFIKGGVVMISFKKVGPYQRLLLFICLFLFFLFIIYVSIHFGLQSRKAGIIAYPKDFLTMRCLNPANDNAEDTPFVYANGQNANGPFRIVYYRDFDTFELKYPSGDWTALQTVYKDGNYVTSIGISVGSGKKDVVAAYKKYGLEEYNISRITSMNLRSLDIVLQGIDPADTFLYVDNHNIFNNSYRGTDYWGSLEAIIFILDRNSVVVKIVKVAPTSG